MIMSHLKNQIKHFEYRSTKNRLCEYSENQYLSFRRHFIEFDFIFLLSDLIG
jgi:hypothetical protein